MRTGLCGDGENEMTETMALCQQQQWRYGSGSDGDGAHGLGGDCSNKLIEMMTRRHQQQ